MGLDWGLIGAITLLNVAILSVTVYFVQWKARSYLTRTLPELANWGYGYFRNRINGELAKIKQKAQTEAAGGESEADATDFGGLLALGQQFLGGGGGTAAMGGLGEIMGLLQMFQGFGGGGQAGGPSGGGTHRPGLKR